HCGLLAMTFFNRFLDCAMLRIASLGMTGVVCSEWRQRNIQSVIALEMGVY
ncbi:unnamed protein product, partial [marine sediment metagenome]